MMDAYDVFLRIVWERKEQRKEERGKERRQEGRKEGRKERSKEGTKRGDTPPFFELFYNEIRDFDFFFSILVYTYLVIYYITLHLF